MFLEIFYVSYKYNNIIPIYKLYKYIYAYILNE